MSRASQNSERMNRISLDMAQPNLSCHHLSQVRLEYPCPSPTHHQLDQSCLSIPHRYPSLAWVEFCILLWKTLIIISRKTLHKDCPMVLQHLLFALQMVARLEVVQRGAHHNINPACLLILCHLLMEAWSVKARLRRRASGLSRPHHLCKSSVLRHICISAENTAVQDSNKREGARAAARPAPGICARRGSITTETKAQACRKASLRISKGIRACSA